MSISTTIRDTDFPDLLSEVGVTGTLTQTTGESFDPSTGGLSGGSSASYTVKGVMRRPRRLFMDGNVVTDSRTRYTIGASGMTVTPTAGDYVTVNSVKYTVQEVETIGPAGTAIAYTLVMV